MPDQTTGSNRDTIISSDGHAGADLPAYPLVEPVDLTIDPSCLDLQQRGPFKARLPFGEPIWIATRYEDVKTAYGDRRFGKVSKSGATNDARRQVSRCPAVIGAGNSCYAKI